MDKIGPEPARSLDTERADGPEGSLDRLEERESSGGGPGGGGGNCIPVSRCELLSLSLLIAPVDAERRDEGGSETTSGGIQRDERLDAVPTGRLAND